MNGLPEYCKFFGLPVKESPKINGYLAGGETLQSGGLRIKVLETPGHTEGGVCFLIGNHLFAGDTIFRDSIGRTDLPGGNYELLIQSIKKVIFPLGDDLILHPGHGPDTTVGYEKLNNPFLR